MQATDAERGVSMVYRDLISIRNMASFEEVREQDEHFESELIVRSPGYDIIAPYVRILPKLTLQWMQSLKI